MRRFIVLILVLSVIALSVSVAKAGERRIPIPDDVFYYQPASTVNGAEATWINPAGLALTEKGSVQFMADYYKGDYAKSWGYVGVKERMAFGYRQINNPGSIDFKEMILASGLKLGKQIGFGASYRYFREGPGIYNNRHFWNIGFNGSNGSSFRYGFVFSNLNRGKIDSQRSETEMRYSVAYRPAGNKITFATDMFLSTKTKLSNADFVYHLEATPIDGLYINGAIDNDKNYQFGVRLNLLKYFVGSKSKFDKNSNNGKTTAFIGFSRNRQPSIIKENPKRLNVKISGRVIENPAKPFLGKKADSFSELILTLYRASEDPNISEIFIRLNKLSLGFGQAQEFRNALSYCKSKKKKIISYLENPNNISYYVASITDSIFIPPVSQLKLIGLRAELTFYAKTLDKLGIDIDLIRMGDYKTAPETYTEEKATDENREQVERILDDLYDQFIASIADGRSQSKETIREIIDKGPFTSKEALDYGLVDGVLYAENLQKDHLSRINEISYKYYKSDTIFTDNWQQADEIAVIVAEGEIVESGSSQFPFSQSNELKSSSMIRTFQKIKNDPSVKAVVLRVNSPGGYALAGEEIYHAAEQLAEVKPMVISMGNVAASGGYYISMAADRVYANPATITGSIGIYGGKADFSKLYEKIDLRKELYKRGKYAAMLSSSRPFTEEEREKYKSHLSAFYDHFIRLVSKSRGLSIDSTEVLSQGKVWTGNEAFANGLIDQTGGIYESLNYIADKEGIKNYTISLYPKKRSFLRLPGQSLLNFASSLIGLKDKKDIEELFAPESDDYILARMPFDIDIE